MYAALHFVTKDLYVMGNNFWYSNLGCLVDRNEHIQVHKHYIQPIFTFKSSISETLGTDLLKD